MREEGGYYVEFSSFMACGRNTTMHIYQIRLRSTTYKVMSMSSNVKKKIRDQRLKL